MPFGDAMKGSWLLIACSMLALTACNSRPIYFGSQRSTEGVPGFEDGKKTSPYVKLGKPYMVGGVVYVPRHQPDYDEEGEASWYGPGFHGGKTANGEKYDKYDFTAAHTTLPLPSVVKVTNLKNNKSVYVRVNDRGPFASGRIIDLSKAAAEQIDMVRYGVVKVRVQYMPEASERVARMIAQGRDPKTIDIAREVINAQKTQMAEALPPENAPAENWWEMVQPIPSAQAKEVPVTLPPPTAPESSPFDAVSGEDVPPVKPVDSSPNAAGSYYVQLGSFSVLENAQKVQQRWQSAGDVQLESVGNLHRVRVGPYDNEEAALDVVDRAKSQGLPDARLIRN